MSVTEPNRADRFRQDGFDAVHGLPIAILPVRTVGQTENLGMSSAIAASQHAILTQTERPDTIRPELHAIQGENDATNAERIGLLPVCGHDPAVRLRPQHARQRRISFGRICRRVVSNLPPSQRCQHRNKPSFSFVRGPEHPNPANQAGRILTHRRVSRAIVAVSCFLAAV